MEQEAQHVLVRGRKPALPCVPRAISAVDSSSLVFPAGATRMGRATQVSYSIGDYFTTVEEKTEGDAAVFPTVDTAWALQLLRGAQTSMLLICPKGTGARTLLRYAFPKERIILALNTGRLYAASSSLTSTALLLRRFFQSCLLPLYHSCGAVVYIDDVDVLYNADDECARVLSDFLSFLHSLPPQTPGLLAVGRVSREGEGEKRSGGSSLFGRMWDQRLAIPPLSLTARLELVSLVCDNDDDEENLRRANALAGLGLAEAAHRLRRRCLGVQHSGTTTATAGPSPSQVQECESALLDDLEQVVAGPAGGSALLSRFGVAPPVGVLLHGPPGTGKTRLVRHLARRAGAKYSHKLIVLRLVDVVRGHVGAGEQAIFAAFQEAKRLAPTILFIDEFQAIFVSRGGSGSDDKSLSSMLAGCFDDVALWNANAGSGATVTVIAATNEPWAVDAGFLRPGRFDRCHLVGVLSDQERRQILGKALAADPRTKGYTGADAERLLLLLLASSHTTTLPPPPSVTPDELSAYLEFQEQHQKCLLF